MTRKNEPVPVSIDEKHTAFLFDLNAAAVVEKELGINAMTPAGTVRLIAHLNEPGALRCVVRACLLHQDPALDMRKLNGLLPTSADLWACLEPAWRAFMHWHGKTDEEFDAMLKELEAKKDEPKEAPQDAPLAMTA